MVLQYTPEDGMLHWRWVIEEKENITQIKYFFHRECFVSVAGSLYASEEKKDA